VARLIVNPHVLCCFLRPPLTEVPSLRRSYPTSSVLRTSPPPHTAWPGSRELPVDPDRDHRWGFPCCVWSPVSACCRHYPGRAERPNRSLLIPRRRPSPNFGWVGSCIMVFEACSAFTRVTACRLAKSPCATLYIGGSGGFVASTAAPIATGWSDPVPGRVFLSRCGPAPFHGAPKYPHYAQNPSMSEIDFANNKQSAAILGA
jgi:hypothetical protein